MSKMLQANSIHMHIRRARRKRLVLLLFALAVFAFAVGLVLYALGDKTSYFRMPSEITLDDRTSGRPMRLGGFVEKGTVKRGKGTQITFYVTDFGKREEVRYNDVLPDLFREDQGVIVEGHFNAQQVFIGSRVLAKHDEKYISKDVADRLKAQGLWEEYINRDR